MRTAQPDDLVAAARRLAALQKGVPTQRFLQRLAAEMPAHPFLLAFRIGTTGAAVTAVLAAVALVAPALHPEVAMTIGRLDLAAGMPMPAVFALLSVLCAGMAVVGRQLAVSRGRLSPLLHPEQRAHRKLAAEWMRAEARRRLELRAATARA